MNWTKGIMLVMAVCPMLCFGQRLDSAKHHGTRPKRTELFIEAAYMNEQWVLRQTLPHGYYTTSYVGTGGGAGLGLKSRTNTKRPFGVGLGLDYLQYDMGLDFKKIESANPVFSFLKLYPAIYFSLNTKSAIKIQASGFMNVLMPMQTGINSYFEFGARGGVVYQAFGLSASYCFACNNTSPNSAVGGNGWNEKVYALNLEFYPARFGKHINLNFLKVKKDDTL